MDTGKYRKYRALSEKWVETYEGFMKATLNAREKLWDEFWVVMKEMWALVEQEPELKDVFRTLRQEHSFDPFVMRFVYDHVTNEELVDELRAFAHREPVHFTERNLCLLIALL